MLHCSMMGSLPEARSHMRKVTTGPRPAPCEPAGKETTMLNLAFGLIPGLGVARRDVPPPEADEGFLGKLVLWAGERIRYHRALRELRRLDDRDLDDLNLARIDLPELARRHARMEPISPQA
jgi:uncharacterized protein YjiS (DUF1127 family)